MTAQAINRERFVATYGGIYEHSPWVAEESYDAYSADPDLDRLADLFSQTVDAASERRKLALIRAHPDLAGRTAIRGELTGDSQTEQASAGIDQCTAEEYQQFQTLNDDYKTKFGFPFVMAVRGSSRQEILSTFASRLGNDHDTEFTTAIREIHKIARLRFEAMRR